MKVLLLNAGSSSLKFSLLESEGETVLVQGLGDWAGETTRYHYRRPDGQELVEEVSWRGHGEAVRRALQDMERRGPAVLQDRAVLAAVGHRVVHGGSLTDANSDGLDDRGRSCLWYSWVLAAPTA